MTNMDELLRVAEMISSEAGGDTKALAAQWMLGVDEQAAAALLEVAMRTAQGRVDRELDATGQDRRLAYLYTGIELGIAAERLRRLRPVA